MGLADVPTDKDWFDELFIFNAVSPNTQVKSFELSFSMPEGNLSNTIAIQQMAGKSSITPLTSLVDDTAALEQLAREDKENLVMEYSPNVGDAAYRKLLIREMLDDAAAAKGEQPPLFASDGIKDTLAKRDDGSNYKPDMERAGETQTYNRQMNAAIDDSVAIRDDREGMWESGWNNVFGSDAAAAGYNEVEEEDIDAAREREMEALNGVTSFSSLVKYYMGFARQEVFKKRKNLLPVELSLDLYGISSIIPGDIFRMSYIPRMYFKNCYFQIMQVNDELNTSGWTTSLKCQMRIRDIKKGNLYSVTPEGSGYSNPKDVNDIVESAPDVSVVASHPAGQVNNPNIKIAQSNSSNSDELPPLTNYDTKVAISNTLFADGEYGALKLNSTTVKNMKEIKVVETPDGDDYGVDLAITFKAKSDIKEMGRSALWFVHNEGQDGKGIFKKLKKTFSDLKSYDNSNGNYIEFDDDGWEKAEQAYAYELHPRTNKIKKGNYYLLMVKGMRVVVTSRSNPVKAMKAFGKIGTGVNDKGGTPDNFDQQGSFWGDETTKEQVWD